MVFDFLERNGEIVKSTSESPKILSRRNSTAPSTVFTISSISEEELRKGIESVSEIEYAVITPLDRESLMHLVAAAKYEAVDQLMLHQWPRPLAKPKPRRQSCSDECSQQQLQPPQVELLQRTIRVDIERLDAFMNLFSELLIDRVRLEQLASEIRRNDLTETVEHMTRVSSDLQNIVLKLRMVPVESVFNRFPRMVRDLPNRLIRKSIWSSRRRNGIGSYGYRRNR